MNGKTTNGSETMNDEGWGEPIFVYTRAEALRDGVLVDAGPMAREAGFVWPVALSARVWAECVKVPEGVRAQDEAGRLWDVLWMLSVAVRRGAKGGRVDFGLHVRNSNRRGMGPLVRLYAVVGPGDEGEPVVTVMMPDED